MRIEFKSAGGESDTPAPCPPIRGCAARLAAAVVALAEGHGRVTEHRQLPWASVTFTGTRHEMILEFGGADAVAAAERLIAALPDHEFSLPRYLVADAAVVAVEHYLVPEPRMIVRCEILMLDDA